MLYKKVWFRLDRNGYDSSGWKDSLFANRFKCEITELFKNDGWTLKNPLACESYGSCSEMQKGLQELYIHPTAASGIVIATDIPHIETVLSAAQSFRHYHTDIYEDYVVMPDDEYLRHLEGRREEVIKDILERFKTKRRNLYFCGPDALDGIYKKYRVKRVGMQDKLHDLESLFIFDVFRDLLEQGLIRTTKIRNHDSYRTAKDDELQANDKSA